MSEFWHVFGPREDGSFYVFGPSVADPVTASTLASIVSLPYVGSWDHEPTEDEIAAS